MANIQPYRGELQTVRTAGRSSAGAIALTSAIFLFTPGLFTAIAIIALFLGALKVGTLGDN